MLLLLGLRRRRRRHVEERVRPAAACTAAAAIGRAEYGVGPVAVAEVVDVRQREGLGGVGGVAAPAQRLEGFPQKRVQPDCRRSLILRPKMNCGVGLVNCFFVSSPSLHWQHGRRQQGWYIRGTRKKQFTKPTPQLILGRSK